MKMSSFFTQAQILQMFPFSELHLLKNGIGCVGSPLRSEIRVAHVTSSCRISSDLVSKGVKPGGLKLTMANEQRRTSTFIQFARLAQQGRLKVLDERVADPASVSQMIPTQWPASSQSVANFCACPLLVVEHQGGKVLLADTT